LPLRPYGKFGMAAEPFRSTTTIKLSAATFIDPFGA
jgi:hypothetical protein